VAEIGNKLFSGETVRSTTSATYVTLETLATAAELDTSGTAEYVLIFTAHVYGNSTGQNDFEFEVHDNGVAIPFTHHRLEPFNTDIGAPYSFTTTFTKASSGNITLVARTDGTLQARTRGIQSILLLLDDITEDVDWLYANTSPTGDAPSTFTDGASVTLPAGASDNWLILSSTHWLVDSTNADMSTRVLDVAVGVGEIRLEGEDTVEELAMMTSAIVAGAAGTKTVKTQYKNSASNNNDCDHTQVFALRLDAFDDMAFSTGLAGICAHDGDTPDGPFTGTPVDLTAGRTGSYIAIAGIVYQGAADQFRRNCAARYFTGETAMPDPDWEHDDTSPTSTVISATTVRFLYTNNGNTELIPGTVHGVASLTQGTQYLGFTDTWSATPDSVGPREDYTGFMVFFSKELATGGAGAITATATMAFSAAANLDGDGKLDATPDPHLVFSAAADLKAAGGALNASPSLVFAAATVNLEGLGKLDASPSMSISAFSAFLRVACDQELPPDAILVQTNLSGVVTDIDEPVDSPDGNWLLLS